MKKVIVLFALVTFPLLTINAFAISPQKTTVEGILLETGTSHKNIMPFLTFIAGRQQEYFERRGYFKRIYGQYRGDYILIIINSAGKIKKNLDELEDIANDTVKQLIEVYPSTEGRVEVVGSEYEPWYSFTIEFRNGRITKKKLVPDRDVILSGKIKPNLLVEGVITGGESIAIVNGEMVKEGSMIGEIKVLKIKDESVDFEYQGEVFNISIWGDN